MNLRNDYTLRRKKWEDLSLPLRMYGKDELPEMQIENMWEVYSPSTCSVLQEPSADFSEFSGSDKMYPSMMKPEGRARWDRKNREWEEAKERHAWIKRLAHARFMFANPDLKLAQDLAETDYGKELIAEFGQKQAAPEQPRQARYVQPQAGTGADLHDEFQRDDVDFNPADEPRVTPFVVPGSGEPFSVLATARDEDGRITDKLLTLKPMDHQLHYEYDAGGRLTKVFKDDRVIEEYLYGKRGERYFSQTNKSGSCRFTYGEGLRLVKSGDAKYSYDAEGRLIMKQHPSGVTRYEYDPNGFLSQVDLPDGRRISYIIDPQGMRTAKQVNGKTVETYAWHDRTTLAVVSDAQGGRREFTYDEEGDPVAMHWNGEAYYFASDQVGTVYMVANGKGNEVKRIIRDSFGNMIIDSNERIDISLGFAGGLHDRDTGLVHFGYREYDPSIGRFITPDPIGLADGDVDVYGYCADDPVNFVDRVGLKKRSEDRYAQDINGNARLTIWRPTQKQLDQIRNGEDPDPEPSSTQLLSAVEAGDNKKSSDSEGGRSDKKGAGENDSVTPPTETEDRKYDSENGAKGYSQENKDRADLLRDALKSKLESIENMKGTPLEWTQAFESAHNVKKQGEEVTPKNVLKDWGGRLKEFGSKPFKF